MSCGVVAIGDRSEIGVAQPGLNPVLGPASRRLPVAGLTLVLLLAAFVAPVEGRSGELLSGVVEAGHGVQLDPSARAAAKALAEVTRALEGGELDTAARALERARVSELLADYVDLSAARLLLERGRFAEAALAATAARQRHDESPLAARLDRLRGEALARVGDEAAAREAWAAALEQTRDQERRREIQLAIVESRRRSGELDPVADPERLRARLFPENALPGELPSGVRSAKSALRLADDLMEEGRSERAAATYLEALEGDLSEPERRQALLQRGHALFRLRRYDEAIAVFGQLAPDPEARFWRARSRARVGRVTDALREFEALADTAPPEIASHALFLAGLLSEDRGEFAQARSHYERVAAHRDSPRRAAEAVWRMGWSAFREGDAVEARRRFHELIGREEDPISALRPRYWAARSAERRGRSELARRELAGIAREYPLSYYGWRAQERLGVAAAFASGAQVEVDASRPTIAPRELQRMALLLEAGLAHDAREALQPMAERARTLADHLMVGRLLAEAGDYYSAQRLVVNAYSVPLSQGLRKGSERLWWLSWPPAYRDMIERSLPAQSEIEPALVWAIMREESSFRPSVMSSAGAIGLLQLMPETARRTAKRSGYGEFDVEALYTPEANIALGSAYLDYLWRRFPTRISATIGSYNAGPNAVARWLADEAAKLEDDVWVEEIPFGQTQAYVKRVLRSYYIYRSFY